MAADTEALAERLRAVERALVDGEPPDSIAETAELAARVEELERELAELTERTLAVEALVRALRGHVGHVRHVNREVERRADAALAAVQDPGAEGSTVDRADRTTASNAHIDDEGPGRTGEATSGGAASNTVGRAVDQNGRQRTQGHHNDTAEPRIADESIQDSGKPHENDRRHGQWGQPSGDRSSCSER